MSRCLSSTGRLFHSRGPATVRVPTRQGKLEKVREFEWSGKVRKRSGKNILLKSQGKVRENEMLQLVKDLISRFVKRDVIDSLVTCNDVTSFDTNDEPNTTLLLIWASQQIELFEARASRRRK